MTYTLNGGFFQMVKVHQIYNNRNLIEYINKLIRKKAKLRSQTEN